MSIGTELQELEDDVAAGHLPRVDWLGWLLQRNTAGAVDLSLTQRVLPYAERDTGQVLIATLDDRLHFAVESKQWYVWTGKVFQPLKTAKVVYNYIGAYADAVREALRHVKAAEVVRLASLGVVADEAEKTYRTTWREQRAFRDRLRSTAGQEAIVKQLTNHLSLSLEEFDAPDGTITLENGVLDLELLRAGAGLLDCLGPFTQRRRVTKKASAWLREGDWRESSPGVESWWSYYLRTAITAEDTRNYLKRWMGLALLGTPEVGKGFLELIGPTDSGKSLFFAAMNAVLGDFVVNPSEEVFLERRAGDRNFEADNLRGARLILAAEPGKGKRLNDGFVKRFTGGDVISTERKNVQAVEWRPAGVLCFATNAALIFDTADGALMARLRPIDFPEDFSIGSPARIEELPARLAAERDLVLLWVLEGLREVFAWGYERALRDLPLSVLRRREQLAEEISSARQWLREMEDEGQVVRCDIHGQKSLCLTYKEAKQTYDYWCSETGTKPLGQRNLIADLAALDGVERGKSGEKVLLGLRRGPAWRGLGWTG